MGLAILGRLQKGWQLLVLIDESGCAGFKLGKGSTPFFVVSMVIFHDFKEAERTSQTIAQTRERLRVKPEFKFSKCHDTARDEFFRAVAPHDFVVRAIVVEKEKIYSTHLRRSSDSFYNFFVQSLMKHNDALRDANVKIDGSGDREFRRAFESYIRQQIGTGKVKKLTFVNSKKDNLIQLADMVCGAVARKYSQRDNRDRWSAMLHRNIKDVWEFE